MRTRSTRRLALIEVLLVSLVATLLGRLYFVQMLDPHKPVQTAGELHDARIVLPATRGEIVDDRGRPLVTNRSIYVITVNRAVVQAQGERGTAGLNRLAALLDRPVADLIQQITPCGAGVPAPCWTGEPYQPVPVASEPPDRVLVQLGERQEDYPGVAVQSETVRDYPQGTLAAHELGYTGQVTAADEQADPALTNSDTIGRSGLEESYDQVLRGRDGYQIVKLDARGDAVGTGATVAPVTGETLVTSIDLDVQKLAEKALAQQLAASRKAGYPAPAGSLVVMDPHTGRIIAATSYPTYDPQAFVGGISAANYQALIAPSANSPLVSRAIDGAYAVGSTFKLISAANDVTNKLATLHGGYTCPSYLSVDGRVKTNYDAEAIPGSVDLRLALQYSCDTWFYKFAVEEYYRDQKRIADGQKPHEYLQHMARAFGFASSAGVDLPAGEQTVGTIADRETREARWKANRTQYCADARTGYPDVKDRTTRAYLTLLASQNCTDGWRYRAGDNADLAIGQGETTVSPLQLAVAYSAMVNGGTVYKPTLGWAEVGAHGQVARTITPAVKNKVPVSGGVLSYIEDSLQFPSGGHYVSGAIAFAGSPIQTEIGGKTGTAEVFGKDDTSLFASWGPTPDPKFVVVGAIEQAGTGGSAAAPMTRTVWEQLLGAHGPPLLAGSKPITALPRTG